MSDRPLVLPRRMTDAEALMWAIEKDPALRSAFVNVTLLDRVPDWARLRRRMERVVRLVPRLRQRVLPPPARLGPPVWADDPSFDLDHHVRRVGVPAPGGERQLLDLVARLAEDGFDRARPLWHFWLVEGMAGGRAALVQKLHHTITDGVGGARMSALFVDLGPDGPDPGPDDVEDAPAAPAGPVVAQALGAAASAARRQIALAARLGAGTARVAAHPAALASVPARALDAAGSLRRQALSGSGRSPLWRGRRSLRRHLDLLRVDFEDARGAAKALGGTVNDLWVAGVAGGAGAYHRALGAPVDELRMAMPVSTRRDRSMGGNAFGLTRVLVPAGEVDPAARFEAVRGRLAQGRSEPALALAEAGAGLLALLPTAALVALARQQTETVDFATSNVRGSPVELWLAGARILGVHPMGPTMGAAFNATVFSYRGSLDVGLAVDPAAVDDPDLLGRCVEESLAEVVAAGLPAPARRRAARR